jgi:hypothetical protein
MSNTPKRPSWQIHLLTAIVLVVIAGALLLFVIHELRANAEFAAQFKYPAVRPRGFYPAETATGESIAVVLIYLLTVFVNGALCEYLIRRQAREP